VQPGDSLLKIAQATRPEGVSTAQMMVAIYRANEDAFAGSMDRLKGGRTLKIPERDAVSAVPADEAQKLIIAQRPQPAETRSRPGAAAPAGPSGDDAAALDRALAESRDRAAELEKTLRELRQLIEGQDRQMEELQRQIGGKAAGQPARKSP
jgi:pilus assembly protein FimV